MRTIEITVKNCMHCPSFGIYKVQCTASVSVNVNRNYREINAINEGIPAWCPRLGE